MAKQIKLALAATLTLGVVMFGAEFAQADGYARAKGSAPIEKHNWSGLYFGANGGYGWQSDHSTNLSTDDSTPVNFGDSTAFSRGTIGDLKAEGWFAGLQVGHNWQKGNLVFGVEADIQTADINDRQAGRFTNPSGTFPIDGRAALDFEWFGTARGRIGVAYDRLLVYATAGLAFGKFEYKLHAFEVGGGALFESRLKSDTQNGYVVGAGAEYAFRTNWTMKLEYQYINLGDVSSTAPVTFLATGLPTGETARTDIDVDIHTIRLGINYKFPPRAALAEPLK